MYIHTYTNVKPVCLCVVTMMQKTKNKVIFLIYMEKP